MASGISPVLAFGSGLASGIEDTEKAKQLQQNKQDDMYRELALKTSFEEENEAFKMKQNQEAANQKAAADYAAIHPNLNNSTGQMLYQASVSQNTTPPVAGTVNISGNLPAATNTPDISNGSAPVQGQGQINQTNLQPPAGTQGNQPQQTNNIPQGQTPPPLGEWTKEGGLNSPQGGPVPLQSENIDALKPPSQQTTPDASSLQQGTTYPNDTGLEKDLNGVLRKPDEIDYIAGLGNKETSGKGNPQERYNIGVHLYDKEQLDKIDKRPAQIYQNDATLQFVADKNGLPYDKDISLAGSTNKEFLDNREKDETRIGKLAEPAIADASDTITRLNNIIGLGKYVNTGGASGLPGAAAIESAFSSEAAEMQKDMAYITLRNRPNTGYSRVTNADLAMFQKAGPSFANPTQANYVIAAGLMADKIDSAAYWNFRQNWIHTYGGDNPDKINKLWDAYKDANPIFDPNSSAQNPKLNQNRSTPASFFKGKSADDIIANAPSIMPVPSNMKTATGQGNTIPMKKDGTPDFSGF